MIDPSEYAAYEEWKAERLTGIVDISIETFNKERQALALAYDAGVLNAVNPSDREKINSLLAANPYKKGPE